MTRALPIYAVVLTIALGTTAFAQRGTTDGGNQKGGGHHAHQPAANNGGNATATPQQPRHGYYGGARSSGSTPGYKSPFNQEIHLTTPGYGCYNCGYGSYGGYVYPGAYPVANTNGGTATDAILANGGTFNNINAGNQFDNNPPNTFDQQVSQQHAQYQAQDIYIRPEYPTQFESSVPRNEDGSPVASASSDKPAILVFKDGSQQTVRNYAIYGAYIVVLTPERKKYPIFSLNVATTEKANEEAGYELKLPAVFLNNVK